MRLIPLIIALALAAPSSAKIERRTILDLEPIAVVPHDFGPVTRERAREGIPRAPREIQPALEERAAQLTACYRWARTFTPELGGEARASLEIDEWGVVAAAEAAPLDPTLARLWSCVQGELRGARLATRFTPRKTRASLALRFKPSGQGLPGQAAPHPPAPARPRVPKGCKAWDLSRAPIDELELESLEVTDFSKAQAREERHARYLADRKAAIARGARPPAEKIEVEISFTTAGGCDFSKESVVETVAANLGAYRACWRRALAERPDRVATLRASLDVDQRGDVCAVRISRDPLRDRGLEACLRSALSELWFDELPEGVLTVHLQLGLEPLPPAPPLRPSFAAALAAWAEAALDRGDGRGALEAFSQLLGSPDPGADRCRWLARSLQAEAAQVPWFTGRPLPAVEAFVGFAEKNQIPEDCLEEAWPALSAVATKVHKRAKRFRALLPVAIDRYRLLLRARLPAAKTADLEFYLAEAFWDLGRMDEAAQHYADAARLAPAARVGAVARHNRVLALRDLKKANQVTESLWLEACEAYLQQPGADREEACGTLLTCAARAGEASRKALARFWTLCPGAK